jgi:hypothetical protein
MGAGAVIGICPPFEAAYGADPPSVGLATGIDIVSSDIAVLLRVPVGGDARIQVGEGEPRFGG